MKNLGIIYNTKSITQAKIKNSTRRANNLLRNSIKWRALMQKLTAILISQMTHILEAVKS